MRNQQEHKINESLVHKYLEGDQQALKVLIKRFHPRISNKIYYYTKNNDCVNDLAQECWLVIINGLRGVKFQVGFDAWALSIARNKAVDWVREQQRQRKKEAALKNEYATAFAVSDVEEMNNRYEQIQRLKKALSLLPGTQRMVLSLFYLENYSLKEISHILDISEGTVKSRLFNAREHLKETLQL